MSTIFRERGCAGIVAPRERGFTAVIASREPAFADIAARRERGFAAIVAVFILVVLAGLGAVLVTLFGAQQRGQAFDALGMQAYRSAKAGIDFGIYQALRNGSCTTTSFALPGSLARFSVQVACTSTTHTEAIAGNTVTAYQITATACNRAICPGTADGSYVERQLRVTLTSGAP